VIVFLHGFTIIFQTSINKCTDKKKKRKKIGCCLSFAYAETRLGELWRESSRAVEVSYGGRGETARAVEHA
jgi:hypothetical protein